MVAIAAATLVCDVGGARAASGPPVPIAVAGAPQTLSPGDAFSYSVVVRNRGRHATRPATLRLSLAQPDDTELGTSLETRQLPAVRRGRRLAVGFRAQLPASTPAGAYVLLVCVARHGRSLAGRAHCITAPGQLDVALVASPPPAVGAAPPAAADTTPPAAADTTPPPAPPAASTNHAPMAGADAYSTQQDTELLVDAADGVLVNDSDADGEALHAVFDTPPAHGTLTLRPDGSFGFQPARDYHGTDSFTYQATDGQSSSNPATVTLTVLDPAPVTAPDNYRTPIDTTLQIPASTGVLANDSDPNPLTAQLVDGPTNGQLSLKANGSFTYAPNSGYHGNDTFTYRATDGTESSSPTQVTINVDQGPTVRPDMATVDEGSSISGNVLTNDNDTDNPPLELSTVNQTNISSSGTAVPGTYGTLQASQNGDYSYIVTVTNIPAGQTHTDTFTYTATDAAGDQATTTLTITIDGPTNHPPVASDDSYTTREDTALTVPASGVLSNDTDADGDTLSAVLVEGPAHGTLTLNASGSFDYTPNANYNGADSFTYRADDGLATSNTATVSLSVTAVNDPPVASDDSYATREDTALTVPASGVLSNDTDADGDTLSAVLVEGPAHGTLTLNANGSFDYTPNANYNGTDSFTYRADDGLATSNTATVSLSVTAVNDPPVASDDSYTTREDTALTVPASGVLSNDTDADGDTLSAVLVEGPAHGTLTLNANGSFDYTPNANYNGTDSFTYRADDGLATSNTATVSLSVTAVNDPPVASDDSYTTREDTALTVPASGVLSNDTDADGDTLSAVLVEGPAHGTLTLNSDGSFDYTPNANYNGTDSFTYRADDGLATSNTATVSLSVTAVNDPPVASNDNYDADEGMRLTVPARGVLANDSDVDGDSLTAILVSNPSNGTLTLNADGSFAYSPNADYIGPDSFTYRANDGQANSNTATVTIDVRRVNHPPVAKDDDYNTPPGRTLTVGPSGVLSNDTDADNDPLRALLVEKPADGSLTLNPDGSFTYTPNPGYTGSDSFIYAANDGKSTSNYATVAIDVR